MYFEDDKIDKAMLANKKQPKIPNIACTASHFALIRINGSINKLI